MRVLKATGTALAYAEQQREVTTTDMLLLKHCCDLAAWKRKDTQKQVSINHFFKKETFIYKFTLC